MTCRRDNNLVAVPAESCVRLVSDEGDPERADAVCEPVDDWAVEGEQPVAPSVKLISTEDFVREVVAAGLKKAPAPVRYLEARLPAPDVPMEHDADHGERRRIARALGIDLDAVRETLTVQLGPQHKPHVVQAQIDILFAEGILTGQMYRNMYLHYLGREP